MEAYELSNNLFDCFYNSPSINLTYDVSATF
jgi:hypothetical protein